MRLLRYARNDGFLFSFFIFSLVFFGAIQTFGTIPDPDTFYHAKMAIFLSRGEIVRDFVWLPFTTWADRFADPHFGYHLLLVPFVKLFDPLVGIRVAGVLFAAAAVTMVVWILRRLDVRFAWAFGILLLLTEPFVFRVSLAKAPAISVLLLLVIWWLAIKSRHWLLLILGFAYVWLYNGWPLAFVVVGAVTVADLVIRRRLDVRPLLFITLGTAAGIVINPYFPANVKFMWDFIVRSGVGISHRVVSIGGEWSSFTPWELAAGTAWAHVLLIGAVIVTVRRGIRSSVPLLSAALLTIFFYAATIYARRNVEYFVPFAVIAGALATASLFHDREKVMQWAMRSFLVPTALFIVAAGIIARDGVVLYETYARGYRPTQLQAASSWLRDHAAQGGIIMHSNWSEFPMLFYWDDTHRFIGGLDPTFLYFKDPGRFRDWINITQGRAGPGVAQMISDRFGARFVFVGAHHEAMRQSLEADPRVVRVYADADGAIYGIR